MKKRRVELRLGDLHRQKLEALGEAMGCGISEVIRTLVVAEHKRRFQERKDAVEAIPTEVSEQKSQEALEVAYSVLRDQGVPFDENGCPYDPDSGDQKHGYE